MLNDSHVHFFSPHFFDTLGTQKGLPPEGRALQVVNTLAWEDAASAEALADRWVAELERHRVNRAAIIASVPGDEASVAAAVARHPKRFVGFFMLDPTQDDALDRVARAFETGLRGVCLFPAMHRYSVNDPRAGAVFERVAAHEGAAIFVHCGVLSVGVRKKLGLPSPFEIRFGNPLDLHHLGLRFPRVPIILPHFGAGLLREALMLADMCPNVYLDTSSSNAWIRYTPGLTLEGVFRGAVSVLGAGRLLFGTDSSFFPRGWQRAIYDQQTSAMRGAGLSDAEQQQILGGTFEMLFPAEFGP
jgi:predicted TIM-barrel fold metal-dependent hydrolase